MADLKICRICLRTEAKVYNYDQYQLKSYYEEVLALKVNETDNLPHYFCYECATQLHKFHKFKEKSYCGQKILKEILWKGSITYESIYKINREVFNLKSPLQISNITSETFKDDSIIVKEEVGHNQRLEKIENIEVDSINDSFIDEDNFNFNNRVTKTEHSVKNNNTESEIIEFDSKGGLDKINNMEINEKNDVGFETKDKFKRNNLLDSNNWKKIDLTEDEAVQDFRSRAEDKKYLAAAFKCTDCFKGFSKEEMLKRHNKIRHNESIGLFECRFCHMRFKWKCHLRKHMRVHYTKYECLKCHIVCPIENTALLHEQYHSGVVRKCMYCDEEFRHSSTYYTHLRTHRSKYVCTLCGSSFVSETGLHQHKRLKHCTNDMDSPDDDEEVNTFCSRCDIRFETRKAYEEHLFHSALHAEVVVEGIQIENQPRKILGKKMQDKITNLLKTRKFENISINPEKKRKKKVRRRKTIPTTCHQCGKHFETQAACLKHHLAEHPRTSFYPPNERHICEICGVSLAPGSVAIHQNLHTKEKLFSCETCGRQFLSSIGLKRHMVTHTGEKPFACSLCDKRFTQSNSMKLHYRTFHLKEPYPKRNRRKKIEDKKKSISEESSEDLQDVSAKRFPDKKTETIIETKTTDRVITEAVGIAQHEIDYLTLDQKMEMPHSTSHASAHGSRDRTDCRPPQGRSRWEHRFPHLYSHRYRGRGSGTASGTR